MHKSLTNDTKDNEKLLILYWLKIRLIFLVLQFVLVMKNIALLNVLHFCCCFGSWVHQWRLLQASGGTTPGFQHCLTSVLRCQQLSSSFTELLQKYSRDSNNLRTVKYTRSDLVNFQLVTVNWVKDGVVPGAVKMCCCVLKCTWKAVIFNSERNPVRVVQQTRRIV